MTNQVQLPENEKLRTLLGNCRPSLDLPDGFQNAVWRRIERAQAPNKPPALGEWLDRLAAWLLRPRSALVGVSAMLLLGITIGILQGSSLAHDLAKQQYLTAVSPHR